ncbi:MAG: hypothetical protein HY482_00065 [Candidatus Wildermuthbacteria bacterium]|nr:hypothetical protein [Candidatus Wildermuthbacteria bacterium]
MPQIGPSEGQAQVLKSMGLDPKEFQGISRDHISACITNQSSRKVQKRYASNGEKRAAAALKKRLEEIAGKHLCPGVTIRVSTGARRPLGAPHKIKGVTPNGYLEVAGLTGLINPFQAVVIDNTK